jgi:hypothetical protein
MSRVQTPAPRPNSVSLAMAIASALSSSEDRATQKTSPGTLTHPSISTRALRLMIALVTTH